MLVVGLAPDPDPTILIIPAGPPGLAIVPPTPPADPPARRRAIPPWLRLVRMDDPIPRMRPRRRPKPKAIKRRPGGCR